MLIKFPRRFRAARSRHRLLNAILRYQLLGYCLFLLPLTVWVMTGFLTSHSNLTFPPQLQKASNVLLVLAHPDDESLFFGPTILQLMRRKDRVGTHLLFLSSGNHHGLGSQRKLEQTKSCAIFGLLPEHCTVLDLPELQDDPAAVWPHQKIQAVVANHVNKWKIDAIITFDDYGVSGHKNHIAVSNAVVAYTTSTAQTHSPPPFVTYTLTSTSVLRKYASLGDLPLTVLGHVWSRMCGGGDKTNNKNNNNNNSDSDSDSGNTRQQHPVLSVNGLGMWWHGVTAFQQHKTQNSWDRKLYAVLSRYMWFNELWPVGSG